MVIKPSLTYNKEIYLYIKNIDYQNSKKIGKSSFQLNVYVNDLEFLERREDKYLNPYYFENNDILINLGYYEKFDDEILITFDDLGTYTYDRVEILGVSFDNYISEIYNLDTDFQLIDENREYLSFNVNIKKDGVLAFMTNYNDNYHIYVDGEEYDKIMVNKYFLGTNIKQGNHKIELVYENKLIKKSFFVSLFGIILFAGLIIYERKYKNEKN